MISHQLKLAIDSLNQASKDDVAEAYLYESRVILAKEHGDACEFFFCSDPPTIHQEKICLCGLMPF
jgi:hypothetical protein